MGKYDDLIGSIELTLNVDDVLDEQESEINNRIEIVEKLYSLIEADITGRQSSIFCDEDWAKSEIEYYKRFLGYLDEYLNHIKGV